jgi:outer membrane protein assembly factor BamE
MQKVLIYSLLLATLSIAGCSWLNDMPFVYKPDIQQGNVLEQEAVDKLQPGMSKTQVRYIMGTPALTDVFHENRWDYVYTMQKGGGTREERRVSLFFVDNQLTQIKGDMHPQPGPETAIPTKEVVITVPDNIPRKEAGIIPRALSSLGMWSD